MHEYLIALSYFFALAIVCIVLYAFTYFLPQPENQNKAKSTFYFRLILLFSMAAMAALLLRFDYPHVFTNILNNLFILLLGYNIMFAIYTRYDTDITKRQLILCGTHSVLFVLVLAAIEYYFTVGYIRATATLLNILVPYLLALKKCHTQFKTYRIGDKILYFSLLVLLTVYVVYIALYMLFYFNEKQPPIILYFISLLSSICILFFGFALSIIYSLIGKLRKELITDRLTGAKNRNFLNEVSRKLFSSAKRNQIPVSILLTDIDLFKNINDKFGHATGDKVLIAFVEAIEKALRAEDILIRIGGEEFVILLPHNNINDAKHTAERIRSIVEDLSISINQQTINISASFGVSQVDVNKSLDDNINDADIALYQAKHSGRNSVVVFNNNDK